MSRRIVDGLLAAWVVLAVVSSGFGASIAAIGVISEQAPFSDLRALSSDGAFAVGGSRNADGIVTPYLWTRSAGIQPLPNPSGVDSWATGVDDRPAVNEIVVAGQIGGTGYRYNSELAIGDLASGIWSRLPGAPRVSEYNALSTFSNGDKYYIAGNLPGSCASRNRGYRYRGSTTQDDAWSSSSKWDTQLTSVATNGTSCGFNSAGTAGRAPVWTAPPAGYAVLPSEAPWEDGAATGISANGAWLTGTLAAAGRVQAFRWPVDGTAIVTLSQMAGDTSAFGMDCADSGAVVGGSVGPDSRGQAVVWDLSGLWGSADAPVAIAQVLTADGVDLSEWDRLTVANAISGDGTSIAGEGIWAADGSTRAWVATVPEPAAWVLTLAAIGWLVGRGRQLAAGH